MGPVNRAYDRLMALVHDLPGIDEEADLRDTVMHADEIVKAAEELRDVIILGAKVNGVSQSQMARDLGITPQAVHMRLQRIGTRQQRRHMEREFAKRRGS